MNFFKLLTINMILLLLVVNVYSQQYPILQSRRVNVNNYINDQLITVPFQLSSEFKKLGVVLSITSFSQARRIGVQLTGITKTSFTVITSSNLYAFSYLLVANNYLFETGEVTLMFEPQGIIAADSYHNSFQFKILKINPLLESLGKLEAFISLISAQQNLYVKNTLAYCVAGPNNKLSINKSIDVTKLKISFLYYLAVGQQYGIFRQYNGTDLFNNAKSYDPIFIGAKMLSVDKSAQNPYKIIWTSSLTADKNRQQQFYMPYVFVISSLKCQSFINGLRDVLQMTNCLQSCSYSVIYQGSYKICTNNSQFLSFNSTQLPQSQSPLIQNLQFYPSTKCELFTAKKNYLHCSKCNKVNNFIEMSDGSCLCKPGYFSHSQQIFTDPKCYQCEYGQCPFQTQFQTTVTANAQTSSQWIVLNVKININVSQVHPFNKNKYQDLVINVYVNDTKINVQRSWISNNQVNVIAKQFTYSQVYKIDVRIQSSIVLQGSRNDTYYQYLTPRVNHSSIYTHPISAAGKIIASSMRTIATAAPTAALASAICGAKINIFSFMQASSIFYLSSYIGWQNYGSISRISLTQMMFKLSPSNFLKTFGASIGIHPMHSDDDKGSNIMLRNNEGQMYLSIVPEILLSAIAQVLLIQLLIRILMLAFPTSQPITEYEVEDDGSIKWKKKSFLTEIVEQQEIGMKQKIGRLVHKISGKKLIFFTTLINSQIAYHTFMVFSQLIINVSTMQQLVNCFFSIGVLGMLVLLPCLGPRSPLILLKSIGIIYKKRQYTIGKLYLFYFINLCQLFVYGASIALFQHSLYQCIGVIVIIGVKVVFMFNYFKNIELFRNILLLLYFGILAFGNLFSNQVKLTLQTVSIALMLSISGIQLLKIVRSIVVLFLSLLKQPASIEGKSLMLEMKSKSKDGKQKKDI